MGYSKTIVSLERNMAKSMKNGKGVRIKYQTPCLFDLGSGIAYGACQTGGSPEAGKCQSGTTATGGCLPGTSAPTAKCDIGHSAGDNCLSGGSAGGKQCNSGGNRGG